MFVDARSLADGATLDAEVCIVGAGAAGITLARELAGRPFRVCLLESGGFGPDRRTRSLSDGEVSGLAALPLTEACPRRFGGATSVWSGWCRPFDRLDFEARDGIPHSGWPFGRDALDPFYARAHAVCELGPYRYEVDSFEGPGRWRLNAGDAVVTRIFQFSPTAFGRAYRDTVARAANLTALLHANVTAIETDAAGRRVTGLRVATLAGNGFTVTARLFVLAAGGIGNARLLLASNQRVRCGIGNQNGLVGRFFADHPYLDAATWLRHPPDVRRGLYRRARVRLADGPARAIGTLSLARDLVCRERILGSVFFFAPRSKAHPAFASPGTRALAHLLAAARNRHAPVDLGRHVRSIARHLDDVAIAAAHRALAAIGIDPGPPALRMFLETAPNPESRVTLTDHRDRLGMPQVRVDWRLTELDRRSLGRAHALLAGAFARHGLGELRPRVDLDGPAWLIGVAGANHHIGTTRMHPDPRSGVVDADGRVHGTANLFVAGSSVFPTAGSANPTLTIVALALRLADHLEASLRAGSGGRRSRRVAGEVDAGA